MMQDVQNKLQAEQDIGDYALQDGLDVDDLCDLLFTAKSNGTFLRKQTEYAERLLNEAMQRAGLQPQPQPQPLPAPAGPAPFPLPAPQPGPTPGKKGPATTSNTPTTPGFLMNLQLELNNLVKEDKKAYNLSINARSNAKVPQDKVDEFIATRKKQLKDDDFRKQLQKLVNKAAAKGANVTQAERDAFELEHENKFLGFGLRKYQSRAIKDKQAFGEKYAIDKKQLKKNILALKYLANANNVATFKPIEITDHLRTLIEKYVMKGNPIEDTDFKSLSVTEKRILKRLYTFIKVDHNLDHNEDFQKQFQIMYGSFLAGNNNEDLIKQLKEYVKLAVHEAIISKSEGKEMLQKLNK
jgi:hypothetical protein